MKLSQLSAKPQLIKLEITDEVIVQEYSSGEPIEFWTWDRQPISTFMKLAASQGENPAEMIAIVRDLILDETGQAIMRDDKALPAPIMMRAVALIVDRLGK